MLPTGHIAAGYLTAYELLQHTHFQFTPQQKNQLLLWGMFFGFAPDIDVFYVFLKTKSLLVSGDTDVVHRKFFWHAPIVWLSAGLLIYFIAPSGYTKFLGLLLWLCSWSHFLLDSIEYGIMWLWPFNHKVYALKNRESRFVITEKNWIKHSWQFLKLYSRRISFYLEMIVILTALIIYFK